ncbi:MAG: PAS domain-containing sensor histidine kinase [bacterium]|nr:PAS domain-containing sensor histidine kinase [bacterium]
MGKQDSLSFQQSEHFYQYLFDSAPDIMMMIDGEGQIQMANSRFEEVLGRARSDVLGQPFDAVLSETYRSTFWVIMTGVKDGTPLPEAEVAILDVKDREVPMMMDLRPILDEGQDHFLMRLRDLREIKVLEQEYRNLFESISEAVVIGDPDSGQIYQVNRQVCELTGYSPGELMGADFDRIHGELWDTIYKEIEAAGGHELSGRETVLLTKGGDRVPVEIYCRIVPRGEDRLYIESAIDISERKALEQRMGELRDEWDSFILHELRSPLTPILAFSQILMEDYDAVKQDETILKYMNMIWQGGKRLENLLDLTREVSQYEQGKILLNPFRTNFYQTVHDSIQDAALGAGSEEEGGDVGGRIRFFPHDGAGETPEIVMPHDLQKLQRAIANLVKNALEHDPGEITVRVRDLGEEVELSVHNWGDPIPEDRVATIFEKFNTTKRDKKGTGLGTTIARLFVEAHGGRIWAESSKEKGTTFTIVVPKEGIPEIQ